jgi:hypothetical protein
MSPELLVGILSLIAAVLALPKIGIKRFFVWAGATVAVFLVWSYFKADTNVVRNPVQTRVAETPDQPTSTVRDHAASQATPATIPTPETYRSDELPSGACKDFSGWYSLCSTDKAQGWTIVSQVFQLTGDRSCSGWARCEITTNTPTKVCYRFQMQGHDEECGHSGNTGIHYSRGQLDAVWQHQ